MCLGQDNIVTAVPWFDITAMLAVVSCCASLYIAHINCTVPLAGFFLNFSKYGNKKSFKNSIFWQFFVVIPQGLIVE